MEAEEITVCKEWVTIEDYEFKILILTSMLAENNLAYRGTLTNMCEWLKIANAPKNTKRIKEAIAELEKKGYIFYHKEGQTHHISITNKGLKDKRIVKIKKSWVKTIQEYNKASNGNINRSWDIMTKCLVTILDILQEHREDFEWYEGIIITMAELGKEINRSEVTTGKIAKALTECNFEDGLKITKDTIYRVKDKQGKKEIRSIGSNIKVFYEWSKEE